MTWLLRLFLVLLLLTLIRRFFSRLFRPSQGGSGSSDGSTRAGGVRAVEGKMVKDPQCGMYVASTLALNAKRRGEVFYFCSEECRDRFLQQ
ncbi:MAG TPA: YHS domain-containing protein [Acidobacteriota bacterium]|nr:YHS domain-containing protein [Acidobacteriota bacterium]